VADRVLVKAGQKVTVTAWVSSADRSAPVGTVTVSDGGRVLATADVPASARGRVSVALPALPRGLHLLRVSFSGGAAHGDSRAVLPVPVVVY